MKLFVHILVYLRVCEQMRQSVGYIESVFFKSIKTR